MIYHLREERILRAINNIFTVTGTMGTIALFLQGYKYMRDVELAEDDKLAIFGLAGVVPISLLVSKFCRRIPLRIYSHESS